MVRKGKLTTLGEARRRGGEPLDEIVGMTQGDGVVTGENFHDYLYYGGKDASAEAGEVPSGETPPSSRSRETVERPLS